MAIAIYQVAKMVILSIACAALFLLAASVGTS